MSAPLSILTESLEIRWLRLDDAPFILELVNDPEWIRFIGDKQVHSLDDARGYLESGPLAMYREHGFGLNHVALRDDGRSIGICGILQRDSLPDPDLGFALLPRYRRQGYAAEAADAVLRHAREELGLVRVVAILSRQNVASRKLLQGLGFEFESELTRESGATVLDLYACRS